MSLEHEPSSEPLHIFVKYLFSRSTPQSGPAACFSLFSPHFPRFVPLSPLPYLPSHVSTLLSPLFSLISPLFLALQWYLAHEKPRPPLEPPQEPGHDSTVGCYRVAIPHERGTTARLALIHLQACPHGPVCITSHLTLRPPHTLNRIQAHPDTRGASSLIGTVPPYDHRRTLGMGLL